MWLSLERFVRQVVDQYRNGAEDWPQIELELRAAESKGLRYEDTVVLLVGLRACELRKAYDRRPLFRDAQSFINRKKGRAAIDWARGEKRTLSARYSDRLGTLIIYGFFVTRGKRSVSAPDIRALQHAIVNIIHVRPIVGEDPGDQLYQSFRQRVRRLQKDDNAAAEASDLFLRVYAIVFP